MLSSQHTLAFLLNVIFDLIHHQNHLLFSLLEVPSQQREEAVDVLQDLFGVVVEGIEGLLAEPDEL